MRRKVNKKKKVWKFSKEKIEFLEGKGEKNNLNNDFMNK